MNKLNHLLKNRIIPFILGGIVFTTAIALADTINSNEVLYDNSNSGAVSTDVQGVLDTLFDVVNHSSTGFSLLTHNPVGICSTLQGGMYRYQGTTADNYICFGTTDKNTCTSDYDKYMYRIIGITSGGQLKLIKKEALNELYQWHTRGGYAEDTWPNSSLYAGLNGSLFLTNTTYVPDSTWSNRIATSEWHYLTNENVNRSAADMATVELAAPITNGKVGLMYVHDYYYSLPGGNNCYSASGTCKTSWIFLWQNQNDSAPPNCGYEWTITLHDNSNVWSLTSSGGMYYGGSWAWYVTKDSSSIVRPTFYLTASQEIASGSGTITDPYILN